ncbi:MAG: helix-turn-helix transcriptional regulator [Firmicutes bacterium]|nr:helix-turn-helix transcriptional regulator [Bacillota bacterium]
MNLLKLGENVRKLRIKKELSQAELAELTSLSPNYINSNI